MAQYFDIGKQSFVLIVLGAIFFAAGLFMLSIDLKFTEAQSFAEFFQGDDVSLETKIVLPLILPCWTAALIIELRRFKNFINFRTGHQGDIFG